MTLTDPAPSGPVSASWSAESCQLWMIFASSIGQNVAVRVVISGMSTPSVYSSTSSGSITLRDGDGNNLQGGLALPVTIHEISTSPFYMLKWMQKEMVVTSHCTMEYVYNQSLSKAGGGVRPLLFIVMIVHYWGNITKWNSTVG